MEKGWFNGLAKTPYESVLNADFEDYAYLISLYLISNAMT